MERQRHNNIGARVEWAERHFSDRYFNPNNMLCYPWNQRESMGRMANENAFYTKAPGCSNPTDRTIIENNLRPTQFNSVGLGNYGMSVNQDCYKLTQPQQWMQHSIGGKIPTDNRALYSMEMRRDQWLEIVEKQRDLRAHSGML